MTIRLPLPPRSLTSNDLLQTAMEMMGTVGVIVNCALIGLSGQVNRMFPDITPTQTILLIIVLEVKIFAAYFQV